MSVKTWPTSYFYCLFITQSHFPNSKWNDPNISHQRTTGHSPAVEGHQQLAVPDPEHPRRRLSRDVTRQEDGGVLRHFQSLLVCVLYVRSDCGEEGRETGTFGETLLTEC